MQKEKADWLSVKWNAAFGNVPGGVSAVSLWALEFTHLACFIQSHCKKKRPEGEWVFECVNLRETETEMNKRDKDNQGKPFKESHHSCWKQFKTFSSSKCDCDGWKREQGEAQNKSRPCKKRKWNRDGDRADSLMSRTQKQRGEIETGTSQTEKQGFRERGSTRTHWELNVDHPIWII